MSEASDAGREPVERADLHYAAEPRFPWPLALAWLIFAAWGARYVVVHLLPAYRAWSA